MRTVTVNEISQIVAVEDLEKDGLLYLIDFKTYDGFSKDYVDTSTSDFSYSYPDGREFY